MKRAIFKLLLTSILVSQSPVLIAQLTHRVGSPPRHWVETESETLWRGRYTNCDYGYYILLNHGTVGHGSHSPSPNHGFLVSLPDTKKVSDATDKALRFIWVDASYDASDDQSLAGNANQSLAFVHNEINNEQSVFHNHKPSRTTLAGLPAIHSRVEHLSPTGNLIVETIVASRSGIIYTIGLKTLQQNRIFDEQQFQQIVNEFRLLKLPKGECSNGR